jgi:Family of unknown function (DUF5760)
MSQSVSDQFRSAMSDWVEIKKQLSNARSDMKVLNNREKQLKEFIKNYMKSQKIDLVNLKKGKVTLRTTQKKSSFTKAAVVAGLTIYFQGDEVKVESVMTCINDNLDTSQAEIISLTGIKTKQSE